nr:echinoderm microtubule-associated protein-like 1 [Chrysemys picta bellii]
MAERAPGCAGPYDTATLLQFCNDDNLSGTSGMEVDDRISYLEQRLQLQEDEIQVLKAALADVLRRLNACEETGLSLQRKGPTKVCQLLKGLPSKPTLSNGILPQKRSGGYSTSPSSPKREPAHGAARSGHRCPSLERPAALRRDCFREQRSRTTSSSSSCSGQREGYVSQTPPFLLHPCPRLHPPPPGSYPCSEPCVLLAIGGSAGWASSWPR